MVPMIQYLLQISDYPQEYLECTEEDQKLLALFEVDTGPYQKDKFGYRKRTAPLKLVVKLPFVEERLDELVNSILFQELRYTEKVYEQFLSA